MDWDTPSRTRLFAAAALLLGGWGLYAAGSGGLPLLWTGSAEDPHAVRLLSAPGSPESWRDAPASLPGAALQAAAADAAGPGSDAGRAAAGLSSAHYTLPSGGAAAWHEPRPRATLLPGPSAPYAAAGPAAGAAGARQEGLPSRRSASRKRPSPSAKEVQAAALAAGMMSGEPKPSPLGPPGRRAAFRPGRRVIRQEIVSSGPEPSFGRRSRRLRTSLRPDPRLPSPAARRALRLRFKPLLLSKLLGRASIRPPRGAIAVPDLSRLSGLKPRSMPDGRPVPGPAGDAEVETLSPAGLPACPEKTEAAGHWHLSAGGAAPALWHAGTSFGREVNGGWAWLSRSGGRWWSYTAAGSPTWLRYRDRWWWRSDGLWFLLHDGEAWGYKILLGTDQEGFGHPGTGAELVYSADGKVAALVIPGLGAVVYDAYTGAVLARLGPESLPRRPRPKAPSSLSAPR